MKQTAVALTLGLALAPWLTPAAMADSPPAITAEEAHAIGVDAYLYFYPLVTMDVTRRQLTNIEPESGIGGPMNMFANIPEFPTADMRVVVRPNFDTLYSSAWLDLTKEPVVVSVPDTGGRYYLLPDARHVDGCVRLARLADDRHAAPETSSSPARLAARSPDKFSTSSSCRRTPSASMHRRPMSGSSAAPRPTVRRTTMRSTRSRRATRSRRSPSGARTPKPVEVKIDPTVDMKTPPKVQVDTMPAGGLLRLCRRAPEDHPAAHHRPADHRPAEADRHRARQELRHRQARRRRPRRRLTSAPDDARR